MARRKNTASGVYQYLEMSGVLDSGSGDDIALKRKEYWNMRKRQSKQEQRRRETEFKIYLDDAGLRDVTRAAKMHGVSRTRYIKLAAIAAANQVVIIPNPGAVNHLIQLLSLNYAFLQEMAEGISPETAGTILRQMSELEQKVLAFCRPENKIENTTAP